MGWFISLGFLVMGSIYNESLCYIAAGLFAIAGAISFKETHLKIENTIESKGRFNNE